MTIAFLGLIPGMGGSQRLTRAIGKAKAMDLILTGRMIDAGEAERAGLVSRLVAAMSKPAAMLAKEAVNRAFESGLSDGLLFERRLFRSTFATHDQKEGMAAFTEKRPPEFRHA
ncbi:enoyl-CoA hydratase-related protein [Amycolatopsis iheyensis]|uniref:enoyl-CoA hydratase-related protein n=1 Tax=Amycolatopsis iheyensis TaxID=2945988 RepID=UPI0023EE6B51|nr:enoyl-CoA hydratase-related protein [Amycolatopsis iheyensis]